MAVASLRNIIILLEVESLKYLVQIKFEFNFSYGQLVFKRAESLKHVSDK